MSTLERARLGLLRFGWRRRWSRLPLEHVVRRFASPGAVNDYMQVCFAYTSDRVLHGEEELWQPPGATFRLRRGDCEDFAIFAWHVLRLNGHRAHVFAAFTGNAGHAVCAFREGDRYHTICNEGLRRTDVRAARSSAGPPTALPEASVARGLAEAIYPRAWTSCGFVRRMEPRFRRGDDGAQRIERFVPRFAWVEPA